MGNLQLKSAFKGHLKNEVAEEMSFHMNAEFLFEQHLIDIIFTKVKSAKVTSEFEIESFMKENNNQVNSHCEDINTKKLIAEIHQNVTAGFSSAEANLEFLKEPNYDKHFTVYCPTEVSEFTTLQQKKFFILYNLYVERYKESKKEGAGFFDFVRRFFEEKDNSQDTTEALQISLQGGLKFSIHLLKEIAQVAPHILKSSLEYLYESFRNASPAALYGVNKTFFVSDQSINEARSFLTSILEDQKQTDMKVKEIALKLMLVIGIMRANVEDLTLAINIMDQQKFQFDISEEISRITFDVEESALNPRLFQEIEKVKQDAVLFYIQKLITPADKPLSKNVGFTTDGSYFYLHIKNQGLFKIGLGENGDQMLGKVYMHKSYRLHEKCKLVYLNGQLLCRSSQETKKQLLIIDPVTLEETKQVITPEKGQLITLEWKDDKENNRYMGVTPLFTDSNYLYVISGKKPEKDDDEEEEKEEVVQNEQPTPAVASQSQAQVPVPVAASSLFGAPAATTVQIQPATTTNQVVHQTNSKKNRENQLQLQFILEVYDINKVDNKLKLIKQIPLMKDKDNAFIKARYLLKRASFVTNQKLLMMVHKRHMHFFDIASGVRLHKTQLKDDLKPEQDGVVTYDIQNHRLWYLNRKDKDLYSFICPNFKRVVKEESEFQIQFLKRRIAAIRKKTLTETKTVKEKQMDNVLTALGIQPIKTVIKDGASQPFDEASINENKFLIMSLLADSSNNLERERPQISWNPKKYEEATKRLLSQFKSPFSTNLTPFFFTKLSELLQSSEFLIDAPKTSKTLEQQYSFYFTLKVLKSNLISLTICEIDLKDVIQDEAIYDTFYTQFKSTVVKIIEKGYNKDFQNQEIKLLWKEIYDECLLSMSMGLGMIYNSFQEINSILKKSLSDLSNPKNREYALLVITNFARHETIRKLINSEENMNELFTLFSDIMNIQGEQALQILTNTTFPDGWQDLSKSDLQNAAYQFIYRFCEKFLVFYSEYKDNQIVQKKYMEKYAIIIVDLLTQQCSQIAVVLKKLLVEFYIYLNTLEKQENTKHKEVICKNYCQRVLSEVTNAFQLIQLYVNSFSTMEIDPAVMSPISNSIIGLIDVLCTYFEDVKKQEKTLEQILNPTFTVESSHPYIFEVKSTVLVSCKGAESFKVKYSSQSKFPPQEFLKSIRVVNYSNQMDLLKISSDTTNYNTVICDSKDDIEIQFDYADLKKLKLEYLIGHPVPECYGFKLEITPSFGSEILNLTSFLDQILRSSSWLVGRYAYSLMRIKKVDKETDEEKNYKLLLQSKIFSGGFSDKVLVNFSKKNIKKIKELSFINNEHSLLRYFSSEGVCLDETKFRLDINEQALISILNPRADEKVDRFIEFLQKGFAKTVMWGNVGGLIGEKMVRSAFAPMIKFSSLSSQFNELCDQYQLEQELLKDEKLTAIEKDQKILALLLENPSFDQIRKRWATAGRMRTFYAEMKKSISDALEKRRQKLQLQEKTSVKEGEENDDNETMMIDTSSVRELPDPEELKLNKTISQEDHDKLEKDIEQITQKIIEKSEFLISLVTPVTWVLESNSNLENGVEKAGDEWKTRLNKWRDIQQSKGIIKSMEAVNNNKSLDSMSNNVLQVLQSAIHIKKLRKQLEQVYVLGAQRVAGLKLIATLMNKSIPHSFDIINWFCSGLRGNTNNLSHYLDDIRGCGTRIEEQASQNFFEIIKGLLEKLMQTKEEQDVRQILNSLRWDYTPEDHKVLDELQIFQILRDGKQNSEMINKLWGAKFKTEFIFKEPLAAGVVKSKEQDRKDDITLLNKIELSREVIDLFETILVTSLGKSFQTLEHNSSVTIKLKDQQGKKGILLPNLEKIQASLNINSTLNLLNQAYDLVFKELQTFVEFGSKFDGINWKVFVRLMNRFRKTGTYIKIEQGSGILEGDQATESRGFAVAVEESNEYGDYGNEEYEGGESEAFVDIDNVLAKQERLKEEVELNKFQNFYNIMFTQRLLKMVNLIASISTKTAFASHIMFSIAHPQRVATLLSILVLGNPQMKMLVIKILEHLIMILPPELFEESITLITNNPRSYPANLLDKIKTKCKIGASNKFTRLIFNYLVAIRNKIWARKFESKGMYGVSTALVNLLRKMFETTVWRYLHESELKSAISNLQTLSFQEKDSVLCLFGGDLQGLSAGNIAYDRNENKITLLGFSDQWIEDQEDQTKKNLKVPKTSMNFEQKTNKAIGLYINETTIDNNEVMILDPQELVLVDTHVNNKKTNQLPIKDLLMDKELMVNLIQEGIINLSQVPSEKLSVEQLNYKIAITKIIFTLINEREEQFIDFLKQPNMNTLFNDFLNLLFTESCKILKTPIALSLDWVEQKCFEIRKAACESKTTLVKLKELSAQVIIDKVFFSFNKTPIDKVYSDYDLLGALNFDNIVDNQMKVDFYSPEESFKVPEFLVIKSTDLYTENGLRCLSEAEVVMTSDELNIDEYFVFLERQERKIRGLTDKPIILIDKPDFEEVIQKYQVDQIHLNQVQPEDEDESDEIVKHARIISEWTGIDYSSIEKMLKQQGTFDSNFSLTSKLNGLIKEEQKKAEEKKKKQEEEAQALKIKKVQQISNGDVIDTSSSIVVVPEEIKEEFKVVEEEIKVEEIIVVEKVEEVKSDIKKEKKQKNEAQLLKEREDMISMVMELVQEDTSQVMKFELKERKKLEQQTAEQLFKSIKGFNENSAYTEYQQSLGLLFTLYSRRILQKILTVKFEESLALMINSPQRKMQFKQFLKIIANEAIFVKFNTRNKKQSKAIDDLLRRIVVKCKNEPQYKPFIDEVFQEDVISQGRDLIKFLKNEKQRSVKTLFSSEEKATKYSNPYFVLAISKIFLEHCQEDLLKEGVLQTIIEQFLTLSYLFNKDPGLKVKINEFILNILEAVQKNYSRLPLKLKEQLQQMWMFKSIVEKYNFNASATDTVYPRHQLLLLEILMKLLQLKKLSKKEIHSIYTKNETLLQIQRAKDVLRETNQYKLLMYLVHFNRLSSEQKTVKRFYESAHKCFDTKVTAQFRIEEIEKMTIMFDELTEIEPDTAVAITRDYEGKEILQVLFAEEIARKSIDVFDENVFMHYPCRPSTIFAFGDATQGKLGLEVAAGMFETPTIIKKVLAKVKDIQQFNNCLIIQLEDGTLYRSGFKEYWNAADKHLVRKWDKKAQTFGLGMRHSIIVNEKGQLQGEGVSNAGGMGTEVHENKTWTNIRINTKEKVVQLSCSYDFSFAVTDQGTLFCAGNSMLTKMNITNLNKFEKIDLGQGVHAVKVATGYSVMALVIVKNFGVNELWSAGFNSKGALGSGENVQTKSVFGRAAYDANAIKFIDVDVYQDHVAAVTEDGQLYQWGFNQHGRCGIRDRDKNMFPPQFWEPKKVEHFNDFFVRQAAVGLAHTLVLASPKANLNQNRVFAYGRDDNNGHHLACTQAEASKEDDFIRHIKRFDHLKVYKVEAGAKTSFVCCEGEDDLLSNRYQHYEIFCNICKREKYISGPLHFTIQDDSTFTYFCLQCMQSEANKDIIPKLCFAYKAQITNAKEKKWPNLKEIETQLVAASKEYTCNFTKQRFLSDKTPTYLSQCKLTDTQTEEYSLCEDSFLQANSNDINPVIYIRIAQGYSLKEMSSVPVFDLLQYYKTQNFYGLRFNLSPDFQYTVNQNIIQDTMEQYSAYADEMKKFDPKLDEDLYKFVEDYCYQNREVQLKDLNPMAIDIDERRFSDKAKKMPEAIKRKRLQILLDFNKFASQLVPFIDYNTKLSLEASARLNAYFMKAKEFIMYQVKYRYQSAYVGNLETSGEKKDIPINRLRALRFFDSGKVDHTGEYTVFGQCFKALSAKKYQPMLVNNSTDRAWNSKFIGEGSIDVGGPYRETFFEICKELQSHSLPLMIKTSNHKNDFGEHRDKWIPNPSAASPTHIQMFEFVGALIGMSIRCSQILNLNFPSLFWKKLIDEPLDRSDLNMIDSYCLQMLDGVKNMAQTLSEREFQEYNDHKFVTNISDGTEVELVPGGRNRVLSRENAAEYVQLLMEKRLNEADKQIKAIKVGIGMVFPQFLMKLYTWKELEYKVCGKPSIDLHHLRAISKYNGCTEDDETCKRFWRVLESFSDEEKSLYLKFVWGRSRLPLVDEKFGDKHTIKLISPPNCDQSLPIAHTCFFAIDVPRYSTEDIMRDKFLYAIKFCQAIDTDGSPYEILGEQSDEDF